MRTIRIWAKAISDSSPLEAGIGLKGFILVVSDPPLRAQRVADLVTGAMFGKYHC